MNTSVNSSMMNETQMNHSSIFMDRGAGYVAYKLIVFWLILIPIAVADILIIIATILEPSIKRTVKVALINIPIACLIVMAGFTIDAITASAFTLARMAVPDLWPCHLQVYLIALGAVSRLVFGALFSVTVYVIVRIGKKATPFIFATVAASLWVFLVLFNCVLFIPGVMIIEWTDGVSCSPRQSGVGSYVFMGIDVVICGLVPFTLTIVMPLLTLWYIKKNLIIEDATLKKTLAKFALFLIVGNVLSITGLLVPVFVSVFSPNNTGSLVNVGLVRTANIVTHLSLAPVPVLILFYFPAIGKKIWSWFEPLCCLICRKTGVKGDCKCCTPAKPESSELDSQMWEVKPPPLAVSGNTANAVESE